MMRARARARIKTPGGNAGETYPYGVGHRVGRRLCSKGPARKRGIASYLYGMRRKKLCGARTRRGKLSSRLSTLSTATRKAIRANLRQRIIEERVVHRGIAAATEGLPHRRQEVPDALECRLQEPAGLGAPGGPVGEHVGDHFLDEVFLGEALALALGAHGRHPLSVGPGRLGQRGPLRVPDEPQFT